MSSEKPSKVPEELPDLDQLASLVEPSTVALQGPAGESSANWDRTVDPEQVDDTVPTDFFHAVKPKPKAVPLAEVGTENRPSLPESGQARWWVWGGIGLALVLIASLTAVVVLYRRSAADGGMSSRSAPQSVVAKPERSFRPIEARGQDQANWKPSLHDGRAESTVGTVASPAKPMDLVRVSFQRRGQAILVPVHLTSASAARSVTMVLDTGATFSTVTKRTLAALGITPSRVNAKVETSNGVVNRPLAVVDTIGLAGAVVHDGLTVGVCDACALAGTDGLLGLNFARHFVVTMDHEAGQLLLAPKSLADKTLDIRPFVALLDAKSQRRGAGQVTIRFTVRNEAPRALREVVIEVSAPGMRTRPQTTIAHLPAGGEREATIEGPLVASSRSETFTLEVIRGRW